MIELLIIAFLISAFIFYRNRRKTFDFFKRCNIPGPEPSLIDGNWESRMSNVEFDSALVKKYGKVVGYYLGTKPVILVADPQLAKIIQTSHDCLDRPRRVPGGINPCPKRKLMLGNLPVDEWRGLRRKISPTFNGINIRKMQDTIDESIEELLNKIRANVGSEVDFYEFFQKFTIEIIGKTAFGSSEYPGDGFLHAVEAEFNKTVNSGMVKWYLCLPEFRFLVHPVRVFVQRLKEYLGLSQTSKLWSASKMLVKERLLNENEDACDLLHHLISAGLSEDQLVANTVLFYEAAYETLTSSLSFLIHYLVVNQMIQNEVRKEIEEMGNSFNQMKFLEAVIKEVLRISPPQTTFISRSSSKDIVYNGIVIPKNTHIQIGLWQIHHDADLWENPEVFDPNRFLSDEFTSSIKDSKFQPFGLGPRHCIGYTYAMMVVKKTIFAILSNFKLKPSPKTEAKMVLKFKQATCTPANGSFAYVDYAYC